jgi:hypothetical protein
MASASYLCVTDMATGFAFDKGRQQWHSTTFRSGDKYIVSQPTTGKHAWEVKEVGERESLIWCGEDFNKYGLLFCEGVGELRMNKHTLRFLYVYPQGYWNDKLAGSPNEV